MLDMFRSVWKDEEGVTTVEYALILALVSVAAILAWQTLGGRVSTTVDATSTAIAGAAPAP